MQRPAYLAGQWYPASERDCRAAIERHAANTVPEKGDWRALIGPHAGWTYSGDAAAHAYRWLAAAQPQAQVVVLFGSHRGPRGPNTLFRGDAWETPLGPLYTAHALAGALSDGGALQNEPVHPARPDNGAELHLPFVRYFWPRAQLLMLGVAAAPAALEIGRRVGDLCKARSCDAVFVGSTDLTHYGPNYDFEPAGTGAAAVRWVREENDMGFIERVLRDDSAGALEHGVEHQSACCPGAAVAALEAARVYGAREHARLVDHYLSCDVTPGQSFVGYAGIVR